MNPNHIFIFSDNHKEVASELIEFGFQEGSSRIHLNQGTQNRKFHFNDFYIELLWVYNHEEGTSSLTSPTQRTRCFYLFITIGMATLFVVSYNKWRRSGTLIESLIYGIFFSVLAGIVVNANQYLVYPILGMLAILWFFGGLVEFSLYSIIV
jgi:hypothetical protein